MRVNKKAVGQRIKSIRLDKGMTLEEFGKLFNVSKSNISHWEAGSNLPNAERLKQISKIADMSVDELLYGKQTEATPLKIKGDISQEEIINCLYWKSRVSALVGVQSILKDKEKSELFFRESKVIEFAIHELKRLWMEEAKYGTK